MTYTSILSSDMVKQEWTAMTDFKRSPVSHSRWHVETTDKGRVYLRVFSTAMSYKSCCNIKCVSSIHISVFTAHWLQHRVLRKPVWPTPAVVNVQELHTLWIYRTSKVIKALRWWGFRSSEMWRCVGGSAVPDVSKDRGAEQWRHDPSKRR